MKRTSLPAEQKQIKNRTIYKGRMYYYVTTGHSHILIQAKRTKRLDTFWKKNPMIIYYVLHLRYNFNKIRKDTDIQLIKKNKNYTQK